MTFQKYLSLGDRKRRDLVLEVQERSRDWIAQPLDAHQAAWILVCGGKVIESSNDLNDYPFPERLMKIGSERDQIPFVFNRPPLLEEVSWSSLEGNDFYPTLPIAVKCSDIFSSSSQ